MKTLISDRKLSFDQSQQSILPLHEKSFHLQCFFTDKYIERRSTYYPYIIAASSLGVACIAAVAMSQLHRASNLAVKQYWKDQFNKQHQATIFQQVMCVFFSIFFYIYATLFFFVVFVRLALLDSLTYQVLV